jgi:ferrous iron transport protein B
MHCHNDKQTQKINVSDKKILLVGNPNVGKSVIFSRLTGFEVESSNYAGTTVSYTKGVIRKIKETATLIDVPGIYSMKPTSVAEKVAVQMIEEGADLIICVLDATHLERNLHLALELKKYNIPTLYVINMIDVARRRGIFIDAEKLGQLLDSKVVTTIAVKNEGIKELKDLIFDFSKTNKQYEVDQIDQLAKQYADEVITYQKVKVSFLERFSDWSIRPITGIPIAIIVLALAVLAVVGVGELLRELVLLPLVDNYVVPLFVRLVELFTTEGLIYNLLVGEYGVLRKGIEWPFALILPYVLLFYIVFSFLEDSGYLPRLGVLLDGIFRKLGLPGSSVIPFIMGYGCAVPAILGTRTCKTEKERIIIITLIAIAIPCTAQTGAFIVLLGSQSVVALVGIYLLSFAVIFLTGLLMNKMIPGRRPYLILEMPNLLLPDFRTLFKKIKMKLKHFLIEAEVPMMIGILLAALIVETNALVALGTFLEPLVVNWLGLPKEASLSLLLGVIRRELAVMPLLELDLTVRQLFVGSVVALFYLPCISVFGVLIKELKLKKALLVTLGTFIVAFLMGGIFNIIFGIFSS